MGCPSWSYEMLSVGVELLIQVDCSLIMTIITVEFRSNANIITETYQAALSSSVQNMAFWVRENQRTVHQVKREDKKQTGNDNLILGTEE